MQRSHELHGDDRIRPGVGWRARSLVALLAVSGIAAGVAIVSSVAVAVEPGRADGTNPADAAASCWEIKQLHPGSSDGIYWLRNDQLVRPEQFYCDMTTDGGGWVMIARGREGWTFRDYGQSTAAKLRETVTGPDAFSPAALSTDTIDALLTGGAVKDLADGLRVRRAADKTGSSWQDLRWNFLDLGRWSWALGGGHRLSSFSIDGTRGTGSNTKDSSLAMWGESGAGNRSATNRDGWFTFPWSGHGRQAGFSYRGNVDGERNATSYLWEYNTENQAIPFTQLFLRPRTMSAPLPTIADGGLPAQTLSPMLDDRPIEIAGGVSGVLKVGDSEPQLDTPVLAITTWGDRVYVGGKFSDVRDTANGSLVKQPYIAAFDRASGAWISTFRPALDGTVWDLDIAGGRLIVAGQFTNVNGVAGTSALAALDPVTGAVDASWRASLSVSGTTQRPLARAVDVDGDWIYVGGNFTSIAGTQRTLQVGRLARVSVATGNPDTAFRPDVHGVPYDVDATNGRVQIAGSLSGINDVDRMGVGTLNAADGSVVGGLAEPLWTTSNIARRYQQAVLSVGSEVWQGGSEHNTHVYRADDYRLLKSYVAQDQGGDTQVLTLAGQHVMQGSHGNAWIYTDATSYPLPDNYTRADVYNWIGAFDVTTHAYAADFVPGLRSAYSEGAWALHTDVDGCVWFGGDFLGGPYVNGQRQYLEGFSKFCPRDTTAPTVPQALASVRSGGGIDLSWTPSTDDRAGYIGYEVLRNDRVVSPLVYGTSYVDPAGSSADRYFVRAVDPAGNRSATTSVLRAVDNVKPKTPKNLAAVVRPDQSIDLSWTASTDNVGIAGYRVLRNGVELVVVTETSVNLPGLGRGTHWLQVQAFDAAGNDSNKTASVRVDLAGADVSAPSVPRDLTVAADAASVTLTASWSASTDDVGVAGYAVYRNGTLVATVAADVTSARLDLGTGDHYIQVAARDAAGNESARTESVLGRLIPTDTTVPPVPPDVTTTTLPVVDVDPPPVADTSNPSTPRDLTAIVLPNASVDVSWSPSRDNVGVTSYRVTRNAVEVAVVPGTLTAVNLPALGPGDHYLQVQAFDAAGNSSYRTASFKVTIAPTPVADTTNPSTPRDLTAVARSDGSIDVAWSASRDNVGVARYRVTRNGVEVAVVASPTTAVNVVGLGPGTHYIQVQAFDAAGNSSYRTASAVVVI